MTRPTTSSLFVLFRTRRDARALAEVFDRTAPHLLRVARHLSSSSPESDPHDLVQQTFLTAIEAADTYDAARPLEPWLLGILVNAARAARRRAERRPDPRRLTEGPRSTPPPGTPDDAAVEHELWSAVHAAVERLPEAYRQVVDRRLAGERLVDTAAGLGRSPATVRSQLHRSLERIRASIPRGLLGTVVAATVTRRSLSATRRHVLEAAGAPPANLLAAGGAALLLVALVGVGLLVAPWSARERTDADPSRAIAPPPGIAPVEREVVSAEPAPKASERAVAKTSSSPSPPESSLAGRTQTLTGRAVDARGRPIGGARVEVTAAWNPLTAPPHLADVTDHVIGRGTTGGDGAFAISVSASGCLVGTGILTVHADDHAAASLRVPLHVDDCVAGDVVLGSATVTSILHIVDAEGSPLADVSVSAWHPADFDLLVVDGGVSISASAVASVLGPGPRRALAESVTDGEGTATLVLPREISGAGPLVRVETPEGVALVLPSGSVAASETIALPELTEVSGRVLGPDGSPLGDVEVRVLQFVPDVSPSASGTGAFAFRAPSRSGREGHFEQLVCARVPAVFELRKPGFRAVPSSVAEGSAEDRTLRMEAAPQIRVTVTSAASGAPLPDARVEPMVELHHQGISVRMPLHGVDWIETTEEDAGVFTVTLMDHLGVADGRLLLRVACEGFAPAIVPCPMHGEETVTVALEGGNVLRGRVVDAGTGAPLSGATVRAQEVTHGDARVAASATTGPDGTYVLAGLEDGTFRLGAFQEGFVPFVSPRVGPLVDESVTHDLELRRASLLEGRVVSLDPALRGPFKIQANPVSTTEEDAGEEDGSAGLVASEVGIGGWGRFGAHQFWPTCTDAEGRFAFANLRPGRVRVLVLAYGAAEPPRTPRDVYSPFGLAGWSWSGAEQALASTTVELEAGGNPPVAFEIGEPQDAVAHVRGRVLNRQDAFEYFVEWDAWGRRGGRSYDRRRTVTPEEDGSFVLAGVSPGPAQVRVHAHRPARPADTFTVAHGSVEPSAGGTEFLSFVLEPHAFVEVVAVDSTTGARVDDVRTALAALGPGAHGSLGRSKTEFGLERGRYRLAAWSGRHAFSTTEVVVDGSVDTVVVTLPLDPIQPWQTRLRTRVVDRGDAPLANTPIALAPPADWPGRPFLSVQTDEDGTLRDDFPVAPGRYAATVHLEGGPGRVEVEVEVELDLSTPRDRIVVDVPDLAPLPEVRVTAVDAATGAPLDSAVLSVQVTTEDGGSGTHLGLRIARDGTVESIRPGRAKLTVRAEGYETESRWIALAQGDPLREVRFALRRTPP